MTTYNAGVPNASQSPGQFPVQGQANFSRLKTIINTDHVFNDTAVNFTDGIHRQVTMITRDDPVAPLPSGQSAILYSKLDANSRAQLWYYNGDVRTNLTAVIPETIGPIRVVGTASVGSNLTTVAYANPGFTWAGTGWAMITNTTTFSFWNLLKVTGNSKHQIDNSGGDSRPLLEFDGSNNLLIRNKASTTQSLTWSLIINKIS
jgi:hypothetical protein